MTDSPWYMFLLFTIGLLLGFAFVLILCADKKHKTAMRAFTEAEEAAENTVDINYAEPTFGIQMGVQPVHVHPEGKCAGEFCCIHNPSDHPLKDAPLNYRADRGLMERLCEHGVGHPDPDDIEFKRRVYGDEVAESERVHGCCMSFCCLKGVGPSCGPEGCSNG